MRAMRLAASVLQTFTRHAASSLVGKLLSDFANLIAQAQVNGKRDSYFCTLIQHLRKAE